MRVVNMASLKAYIEDVRDLIERGGLKLFLEATVVACRDIAEDDGHDASVEDWRKDAATIESILPAIVNTSTGETEVGKDGRDATNSTAI
jgi:hypothetical protein